MFFSNAFLFHFALLNWRPNSIETSLKSFAFPVRLSAQQLFLCMSGLILILETFPFFLGRESIDSDESSCSPQMCCIYWQIQCCLFHCDISFSWHQVQPVELKQNFFFFRKQPKHFLEKKINIVWKDIFLKSLSFKLPLKVWQKNQMSV